MNLPSSLVLIAKARDTRPVTVGQHHFGDRQCRPTMSAPVTQC